MLQQHILRTPFLTGLRMIPTHAIRTSSAFSSSYEFASHRVRDGAGTPGGGHDEARPAQLGVESIAESYGGAGLDRLRGGEARSRIEGPEEEAKPPALGREPGQEPQRVLALDQAQIGIAKHPKVAEALGVFQHGTARRKIGPEHDMVCVHQFQQ